MPPKKNLPIGWKRTGYSRLKDTGLYPDETLIKLAEQFGVSGAIEYNSDLWKLKQRLETAAISYLAEKHNTAGPKPKDVRSFLTVLANKADELKALIDGLDDITWDQLRRTEYRLQQSAFYLGDERLVDIGVMRRRNEFDPEGFELSYSDISDIPINLDYLKFLAVESHSDVKKDKAGRQKNHALYLWVSMMVDHWVSVMNRKFTVTYHQNTSTSPSGQFLEACLEILDPDALDDLVSQMRRVHKNRKNRVF
ncbi:MAG: hypothetical protein RLN96_08990 [Pseudomonadales bacterium]